MTLPDPLARRSDSPRGRPSFLPRLRAIVQAPTLDAELAGGTRPSLTPAHRLRADHLRRERVRRRIATALNGAVEDAGHPVRHWSPQAPLSREAIRCCQGEIRALAESVATVENPRAQGVAIAFQLAFDGCSALFFRPDRTDSTERLADSIRAAQSALRVSADFDEPER